MTSKKRGRRKPSTVVIGREVRVTSVQAYVGTRAEKPRSEPPRIESRPWLVVSGEIEEPVRDVRQVKISVHVEATTDPRTTEPTSVGWIIGLKPCMHAVVDVSVADFAYVWSLAVSGHLRYCRLAFTEPVRGSAPIVTAQFSNRSEDDEPPTQATGEATSAGSNPP